MSETKQSLTILFIDDDEALVKGFSAYFKKIGHRVVTATTGREGLERFHAARPDVSVVDLKLPDISGMEILEQIRSQNTVALMLTGINDIDTAVEAMRLGAENFLTKPIEMSHLAVAIEKAAEKVKLRRENKELRDQISPSLQRTVVRIVLLVALIVISALVGSAIGGDDDPRLRVPIPVPIDSTE